MNNTWVVYCHINKINGKKYVGITGKPPKERWKNGYGYHSQIYFGQAIRKYGWDNFEHIILLENLSKEEAIDMEKYFIKLWDLNNRENGYNLTNGGDGTNGYRHTEEYKRKTSERLKGENHPNFGKKMSEEFCRAVSLGRLGIKFSEEHKNNLSKSHMGYIMPDSQKHKISENSPVKRKVICVETGEIFESIASISLFYNKDARHVSECCQGKRNTWNGLHWEYYKKILRKEEP